MNRCTSSVAIARLRCQPHRSVGVSARLQDETETMLKELAFVYRLTEQTRAEIMGTKTVKTRTGNVAQNYIR